MERTFAQWHGSGTHVCEWVTHVTRTGSVMVFVRRSVSNRAVVEVGNIYTRAGWGAAPHFYRRALAEIPAVAQFIINPELDVLLARWGWQAVPLTEEPLAPTRVNPAFIALFGLPSPQQYAEVAVSLAARGLTSASA